MANSTIAVKDAAGSTVNTSEVTDAGNTSFLIRKVALADGAGILAAVKAASTPALATDQTLVTSSHGSNNETRVGDGTNAAAIKGASTAAAATDKALVVSFAGANSASQISDGTNIVAIKGASTPAVAADKTLVTSSHGSNNETRIGDGTNAAAIKAASTPAAAADKSLVVSTHGSNNETRIGDGTNAAVIKAGSTAAAAADKALVVAISPNNNLPAVPTAATLGGAIPFFNDAVNATKVEIKNTAGQLFSLRLLNTTAAAAYLQTFFLAAASVTVGTTVPDINFRLAANEAIVLQFPVGLGVVAGTGITVAGCTTPTGLTNAAISVAASFK